MAKEEELRPYGGGGAGGKLRTSRFARRSSTPYDRPQTGRHAPAAVRAAAAAADSRRSGNTWFSRIVDPASRLITQSAAKWFSSVFKKNHPALSSAADDVEEVQEDSLQEVPEEAIENAKVIGQDQKATPVSKQRSEPEFTEVEQLLKNKTFSREEFNRLTELLQSRIVDRSSGLKDFEEQNREELHGGAEPSNAVNAEAQRWREERQKAREEKQDSVWHNGLFANAPTPAVHRNLPDEAGSSPADIAKAFMGVRPYRASSLALQSKPFRDENTPSKLNGLSLVPKTEGWLVGNGQAEDKFKTPQTARMRSRIQNISRTPYARNVYQQAPSERIGNGFPISTPVSQWTPIQSPITGGRQVLKRRSSVLDDDFSSGLPIRRTRHKPIFVTQSRNPDPSGSTSNQLIPFLSPRNDGERTVLESVKKRTEFEKQNAFYSREATTKELCAGPCIPPQSSETARKILEHLDRMVPSPKEISAEAQLAIARDKSPSQLTVSMLNGPARRSTESIDATSLFDKYSPISVQKNNQLTGQGASSAEQKYGGKGKAPLFNSVTTSMEAPTSSGIGDVSSLIPDSSPARIDAKSLILDGPSNLPEKSKGFRMSALEESDEEGHASRNAGMSIHAQTGKVPSFASDGNGANSIILDGDKQITSATVLRTRSEANLVTSTSSASLDSFTNNSSGFTFPVTPSNSNFAEPPPTPTVMPSPSNKDNTQPMTANITPTYNFGSASPSKGPVFSFSTSGSTDVDTTKPKFDFKFESKPESSFSSTAVAAAASAPTYGSESLASIFNGSSTSGLSGSSPSFSSSSSIFSTSTALATSAGFPLFGGAVSKTNGMNSDLFSFPGKSSSAATSAKMDSKSRNPDTIPQVEASSVGAEVQSIKSSTSGENCTIKSQNEPKTSGASPTPSLVGVTNGTSSTLSSTAAISASTSILFPNTQSAFAGSLFAQVSTSATATTSAPFAFGSSANSPSLSSSVQPASFFSSSSLCGNTSPSLFGSTLSASSSSISGSLFGLAAPNSSSSSSLPSFGLSNSSTFAQFASSSTPASGSGTTLTFAAGSSSSVGSTGISNFSGSSNTSFGLGSTSQFGSNTSPSFGLSTTPQFGSDTSPSFGLSTTPQFGSSTSPSFGLTSSLQSSSSTAPLFVPGVTFGSNTTSSFTTGSTPSFGSGSTPAFGSGSTPPFGSGSAPSFGSGSTFGSSSSPSFGGSTPAFGSASAPSFGGSSVSFGAAGTSAFGGSSASYGSASTPLFGSSSTPSFGLGQSFGASSATSSQSTLPSFGSGFGGTASLPSAGFSFGGATAASGGSFAFGGGAGSTPSGTTFSFGSTGTTPSTFTFASKDGSSMPQPPIFGLTNSNSSFGVAPSPTPPADQMEDSMAEDPAQVASPTPPVFGGQSTSPASSFVFGSQPTAPSSGQSVFQFGAQPGPAAASPFAPNAQSTFTPAGGGLEFSGGNFSLGAGGERGGRKFIKAKRDKTRRK